MAGSGEQIIRETGSSRNFYLFWVQLSPVWCLELFELGFNNCRPRNMNESWNWLWTEFYSLQIYNSISFMSNKHCILSVLIRVSSSHFIPDTWSVISTDPAVLSVPRTPNTRTVNISMHNKSTEILPFSNPEQTCWWGWRVNFSRNSNSIFSCQGKYGEELPLVLFWC